MREGTSNILRTPFADTDIDQLPRKINKGPLAGTEILLDYVGHAAATARLLDADEEWAWEPLALDEQGLPRIIRRGHTLELWIRLTIDGTSRLGVGTVAVSEGEEDQDTSKELIGDAIRNAAMRFGVALDLWRKHAPTEQTPSPAGPPCPHCGAPVLFNDEKSRGKKPVWSCSNRGCGGGSLRDKNDPSKGNWPWGSYDADCFADRETGGELERGELTGPGAEPSDDFDPEKMIANLSTLGITEDQARAELEAYRDHPGFAAGHVKDMRERVNRACVLLVALGLEPSGVQKELWAEWQAEDEEARKLLTWGSVRGSEVQSFAAHVQHYLRLTVK